MTRHLTDIEIESYRRRATSGEELIAANDHLAECGQCYRRFKPDQSVQRVYSSLMGALALGEAVSSEHLTTEEISGFIDRALSDDEVERCRAHIEHCGECRDDIDYLTNFKSRAQGSGIGPGHLPAVEGQRQRAAFSDPVRGFRLAPRSRIAALATLLLVVAGGAAWLGAFSIRRENARLRGQIDQLRLENEGLKENSSQLEELRRQIGESRGAMSAGGDGREAPEVPANVIVALMDGNTWVHLKRDSSIKGLESAPAAYQEIAKQALMTQRVKAGRIGITDIGRQGALLGESRKPNGFRTVSPVSEAVEPARPAFSWTALTGAASYTVFVKDLRSGSEMRSETVTGTRWTPSSDLVRGHAYAWMVEANARGHLVRAPATDKPLAQFRVIGANEAGEIQKARKEFQDSHLLLGLIYAKAGLRSEAARELKALAEANPDSETARKLYQSVSGK